MNTRILHCGENIQNYYLCIENNVSGFSQLSPAPGDQIYLAIKIKGFSYIGARGIISEPTTNRPWPNSQNYKFAFTLTNIEYCKPFNIQSLKDFGGPYWAAKYLQASKPIKDDCATSYLNNQFLKYKSPVIVKY
jgi:hypothetical protein